MDVPERFVLSFEHLKAWCDRQAYAYRANDELQQIAINYELDGAPAPLLIVPQWDRGMVMFAMRQPFPIPSERDLAILDATSRLNSMSFMGAWTINRDTHELFFRVAIATADIGYTDAGLVHIARIVAGTAERAGPALRAVAAGAEPDTAIAALAAQTRAAAPT